MAERITIGADSARRPEQGRRGILKQKAAVTMGQYAVGARRQLHRASFSDIVGPETARDLVDREQRRLEDAPKPMPVQRPDVRAARRA